MHTKRVIGAVAAVSVLGATGVGIAQSTGNNVEIDAASATLSYTEQSRTDRPCQNSPDRDFVRFQRFTGSSASQDRELNGELTLSTATLIDGPGANADGAITAGSLTILNRQGAGTNDDILTRSGLVAVDQNDGTNNEEDQPTQDNGANRTSRPGLVGSERDFRVEGFTLGRSASRTVPSRSLLGNLNLDVAAEQAQGSRPSSGTRSGEINTGNDAGNDAVLVSGSCDLDGDRDNDFNPGFGGGGD